MIEKRQVLRNAASSVIQVLTTSAVLFILYGFLLDTIGVEKLGVWSVVLAGASVASIANLGFSASVVKFVARYAARHEEQTVVDVIQTAAISLSILVGLLLTVVYPFAGWLLTVVVPSDGVTEALVILPYGLISVWIMIIASVFQAGLDGRQRIDLRSALLIAGAIFHLILCFVLVPVYGLVGLAYAQVGQAGALLIATWIMLRRVIGKLPVVPYLWNPSLFREMVGYGLNLQVVSISQLLYDPVTKSLLTKFGGLAVTGFYEMASRMILQLRALLVSANQVLVPTIADLQERDPQIIQTVYKESYMLLFYISVPLFSIIIALTPVISQLWIGEYENTFVIFSILLALGWFLNTLTAPAYFANLGMGELHWNTLGHLMIAALNLGLGLLLGSRYGGIGVVCAWVTSLIIGSSIIAVSYHHKHRIPMVDLLCKESAGVTLAAVCALGVTIVLFHELNDKLASLTLITVLTLIFLGIVFVPLWLHPMRRRVAEWSTIGLLERQR